MEKNKIQGLIVITLFLVAFLIWLYPFLKKGGPASKIAGERYEIIDIAESGITENFFDVQKDLEEKRPKLSWVRDPFQLPPKGPEKMEFTIDSLVVTGIAIDEKGRIAMINDEIVREGDVVFGVKVIRITEDAVTVEKDGKNYDLKIYY